jgi:hypothetical protein
MEGVANVPVQEIHALLPARGGRAGVAPPALPAEFRFRLKDLRVKRAAGTHVVIFPRTA